MNAKNLLKGTAILAVSASAGFYAGGELHDAFSDNPASEQATEINRCAKAITELVVAPEALEACQPYRNFNFDTQAILKEKPSSTAIANSMGDVIDTVNQKDREAWQYNGAFTLLITSLAGLQISDVRKRHKATKKRIDEFNAEQEEIFAERKRRLDEMEIKTDAIIEAGDKAIDKANRVLDKYKTT